MEDQLLRDYTSTFDQWGIDLDETARAKLLETARDMAAMYGQMSVSHALRSLRAALVPSFEMVTQTISTMSQIFYPQLTRAEIREWKEARRLERHYRMTHGKHGLKRPRGKRNVAR